MPKQKIQIMVEPELLALLRDLSEEIGQPLSPMVNSLLQTLAPGLEKTLMMARQVKQLDRERKDQLQGHLGRISDSLQEKVLESIEEAETAIKKIH